MLVMKKARLWEQATARNSSVAIADETGMGQNVAPTSAPDGSIITS